MDLVWAVETYFELWSWLESEVSNHFHSKLPVCTCVYVCKLCNPYKQKHKREAFQLIPGRLSATLKMRKSIRMNIFFKPSKTWVFSVTGKLIFVDTYLNLGPINFFYQFGIHINKKAIFGQINGAWFLGMCINVSIDS